MLAAVSSLSKAHLPTYTLLGRQVSYLLRTLHTTYILYALATRAPTLLLAGSEPPFLPPLMMGQGREFCQGPSNVQTETDRGGVCSTITT